MYRPLRSVFKNQTVSVSSYHRKLSDEIRDFPAFMCLLKKSGKEASSPDFYPQTISKNIDQRIGLFRAGCPVGGKTDHCIGFIVFFPEAVFDLLPQLLELFILNDTENLVGRRVKTEAVIFLLQVGADLSAALIAGSPIFP